MAGSIPESPAACYKLFHFISGLIAEKLGSGDAWLEKQWIIRPRFTAKLFSKQLLLPSDDFGDLMIDWNDLLRLADLVRAFPVTYSLCHNWSHK
jgi:hypothetical protein